MTRVTNGVTGLDRNPGSGVQSHLVVEAADGTGRGLETGGGGIGVEEETGPGIGIAVEMAGARRAEAVEANRKCRGRRLPTKRQTVHCRPHSNLKSILGTVNTTTCSNSREW